MHISGRLPHARPKAQRDLMRYLQAAFEAGELERRPVQWKVWAIPLCGAGTRSVDIFLQSWRVVSGAEKLLTKKSAAYVALVDAKKLDYYHRLKEEHASLVLMAGLREVLAGHRVSNADLMKALS